MEADDTPSPPQRINFKRKSKGSGMEKVETETKMETKRERQMESELLSFDGKLFVSRFKKLKRLRVNAKCVVSSRREFNVSRPLHVDPRVMSCQP